MCLFCWVQLYQSQHLSGMFNHLHLITLSSAQLLILLIKIALWSGITGKSLGRKRGVIKWEPWYVGSLSSPSSSTLQESTLTYFSLGQVYFNYFFLGCTHFGYLVLSSMWFLYLYVQGQCLRISEALISPHKIPVVEKVFSLFSYVKG